MAQASHESETMHGPVRRRPDGCGLGRLGGLLDRAADIIAARARSDSE